VRKPGVIVRYGGAMDGEGDIDPVGGFTKGIKVLSVLRVKGEDFGCVGFDCVGFCCGCSEEFEGCGDGGCGAGY